MRRMLMLGIVTTALGTAAWLPSAFSQDAKQPPKASDIEREKLHPASLTTGV